MSDEPRKGLGRGLSALLGDDVEDQSSPEPHRSTHTVPIEQLAPGKYQPRRRFDDDELASLVESVRAKGILQPILVRRDPLHADAYEIIAGERRWRAAQRAQLHEVPVIVRDFSDEETLEIALIENLQRENLSPIEEANAFQRLMDEFDHTQEILAKAVGKSRSSIANTLRLLTLPVAVQDHVDSGALSAGHARALVGHDDAEKLAGDIIAKGLSVRQAEQLVQAPKGGAPSRAKKASAKDSDTIALEHDLSSMLGLKVSIKFRGDGAKGGSVSINYSTLDQLDDILQRLNQGGAINIGGAVDDPPLSSPA
ncbi:MAG: ParB/RepB/Spo0J family partition protein [Alphaproteobacteria bacterium]|nr:ParB/RepB/Spo0J family partition protein [Alphaproteobacteria bacterium]